MENPFSLSKEKLKDLLNSFSSWFDKDERERNYPIVRRQRAREIKNTLLNEDYLSNVTDEILSKEIFKYSRTLAGPAFIRLGMPRISGEIKGIKRNLLYIINSKDSPFNKAAKILDGEYRILIFSRAFWTPILQAKYPDTLCNWNAKTERFLRKVGVNVRTSKLSTEEKYIRISEAFQYLRKLSPEQDFYSFDHLMHYGTVINEGVQMLKEFAGVSEKEKKKEKADNKKAMKGKKLIASKLEHPDVQGILLELGNLLGYDTYSADPSKYFGEEKLGDIATLDGVPDDYVPNRMFGDVKNIDVIWFEDNFPMYLFEVEHTTGVTDGLLRLFQIRKLGSSFLYIIAPSKVEAKFNREINKDPFFEIKERYSFRSYEELVEFFEATRAFVNRKSKFFGE